MADPATKLTPGSEPELDEGKDLELPSGEKGVKIPPISIEIGSDSAGDTVMATQAIINRQAQRLDSLKDDMRKLNESLKSILENDAQLLGFENELKESSQRLKERKAALTQSAESVQLKYKVKEIKEQMKELEESLNNHLLNYYQLTGTKVFDTDSGEQREFKVFAKILGKKKPDDGNEG